jgi:hypothetical protein
MLAALIRVYVLYVLMAIPKRVFVSSTCCSSLSKFKQPIGCCLLHAAFLLGLLYSPENGGDMFLWNFG